MPLLRQQAIDPELTHVGVPVCARRGPATLRGDALVGVDTLRLALDYAFQGVQPHLTGSRLLQEDVLALWPIAVAPLDFGARATSPELARCITNIWR